MRLTIDEWNPSGDYLARFEQDENRGYLLLATAKTLLAMVRVYGVDEWPEVRRDEVMLTWECIGGIERCVATVRGRRRYIDVQTDEGQAALRAAA